MSEEKARRDDPIHRAFRALRDGFRTVVVHLVERVDERIRAVEEDERHRAPDAEAQLRDAALDLLNLVTRFVVPLNEGVPGVADENPGGAADSASDHADNPPESDDPSS